MITLGLNAAFHDSSAALVVDGEVLAAAEEERFTRVKHAKRPLPFSAWELPWHAIDYCLAQQRIRLIDVDHVAYSFDPRRFLAGRDPGALAAQAIELPLVPSAQAQPVPRPFDSPWDPLFATLVLNAPRQLASGAPHHLRQRFEGAGPDSPYRFHFVEHHLCHQASAFLASPFANCAVMTLDGRGEEATTAYGRWNDGVYEALGEVRMPHSLGLLYEQVTTHLGFLHSSDEYKVMALAALGTPRWAPLLESHIHVDDDGLYQIDPIDLAAIAGPPRVRGSALDSAHLDLAASLQRVLETTVLRLAAWLRRASGERCLAMAGGVALNCLMNSRLRDARIFQEVWVQPAAGDAGTALGAALWTDSRERVGLNEGTTTPGSGVWVFAPRRWQMRHAYWGPESSDDEIAALFDSAQLDYRRVDDPAAAAAELLSRNQIIGWMQGRMEFGPRALGARSILASPIEASMQARINALKDREDFRPVAPALPRERLGEWFMPAGANRGESPFMLFVYDVRPEQAARIPAACHSDGSARVQTVSRSDNPLFHRLLTRFAELSGVPVLINTSFNVRGEPVVCTPKDAIDAFYSTPLDALVIGSFVLTKKPQAAASVAHESAATTLAVEAERAIAA
jgi:carbamoyltransferase